MEARLYIVSAAGNKANNKSQARTDERPQILVFVNLLPSASDRERTD
jgi:hypothetical protein